MIASRLVTTGLGTTQLTERVIPPRYVWHVSNSLYQRDLEKYMPRLYGIQYSEKYMQKYFAHAEYVRKSIATQGLKCSENGAVFANQHVEDITCMHPLWLDLAKDDIYNPEKLELGWIAIYDFWRIDTHRFKAYWFIDPFMINDLKAGHIPGKTKKGKYICTQSHVPAKALELFRFNPKIYASQRARFTFREGKLEVIPYNNIWDAMCPVEEVNDYIKRFHCAA